MKLKRVDTTFFAIVLLLTVVGFAIFISASLGLLAREGASFARGATVQLVFGLIGGCIAMIAASYTPYTFWRRYALHIFIGTSIFALFVFIPGLGKEINGATRWLRLGDFSLQPSELLKVGYLIYLATWLAGVRKHIDSWQHGLAPFLGITAVVACILLLQKDTDTLVVSLAAGLAMFVASGAKARDIAIVFLVATVGLLMVVAMRPYVLERIQTFLNPGDDPLNSGYQIQQSLIAIGSGGMWGRGFGQSVQKFNYLPEPTADSIFAVYAEEFGFIGCVLLIALFLAFVLKGLDIARRAKDPFSGILVTGIIVLIGTQAFWNIAAMLGVVPLSGIPLVFVSKGGTALLFALFAVGIVLNISRHRENHV